MKNKKTITIAIIIILVVLIIAIPKLVNKNKDGNTSTGKRDKSVENYVQEHYLNLELLDYLTGEVTPENKMAYTIDQINKQSGQRQKELTQDQVKSKYQEIFAEELQITEAAFMLPNNYEFERSRATFLDKREENNEQNVLENTANEEKNTLEITGSKYDKSSDKYIVTIQEKSGSGDNAIVVRTTNMELKSNSNGGYVITDYYKENK